MNKLEEKVRLTGKDVARAKENGISLQLVYARINGLHWSHEKAVTKKPRSYGRWPEYRARCEANGIPKRVFDIRTCRGMDPEEACTRKLDTKKRENALKGVKKHG